MTTKPTIDEQNNDDFGVVNIERMQCFMPKDLEALLTEARINELERAKVNSYIPATHIHKVDRRLAQLRNKEQL